MNRTRLQSLISRIDTQRGLWLTAAWLLILHPTTVSNGVWWFFTVLPGAVVVGLTADKVWWGRTQRLDGT